MPRRRLAEDFGGVAAGGQGGGQLGAVLLVAHREGELDLRLPDREAHALAVVLDRDDVGPFLRDELQQLDQLAGTVAEPRPDDEEPTGRW